MNETTNHHRPTAQPITASARDRVTGMDVRIDRVGVGRPLVILNGLLGQNEHWFPCLGPLAERAECLLIQPPLLEMRGRGCSIEGVVALIVGLMESLVDTPVVLMGNSLGGHVALRIALERPDLIRGLVLIGSSGLLERTVEKNVPHSPSREWIEDKIHELFYDPSRMRPGLVDMAYEELSRRSAARAFVRLGRSAKNDHLGDVLHRITPPAQIVWGRCDVVTPPEVAEQFARELPNARLSWVESCGHAPQIEHPEKLAAVIARFLDDLAAGVFDGDQQGETMVVA